MHNPIKRLNIDAEICHKAGLLLQIVVQNILKRKVNGRFKNKFFKWMIRASKGMSLDNGSRNIA